MMLRILHIYVATQNVIVKWGSCLNLKHPTVFENLLIICSINFVARYKLQLVVTFQAHHTFYMVISVDFYMLL